MTGTSPFREVINAVRYLAPSGCGWRRLPVRFGCWRTVHAWSRELARGILFQTIPSLRADFFTGIFDF